MPRIVKCALIQAINPKHEGTPEEIKEAMIAKHIPMIEEAGKKQVQILCLQELFHGPYFAAEQDIKWYRTAEPVPGPITERFAPLAKKYNMVMIVPVYEMEQEGVYFNTAQVIDRDPGIPRFRNRLRPHRRLHLLRQAFSGMRPGPGAERGGDPIQPLGHHPRQIPLSVGIGATGPGGGQRSVHRSEQPGRHRKTMGVRQVLRFQLLLRSQGKACGEGQ
jgi:hypothetical protein